MAFQHRQNSNSAIYSRIRSFSYNIQILPSNIYTFNYNIQDGRSKHTRNIQTYTPNIQSLKLNNQVSHSKSTYNIWTSTSNKRLFNSNAHFGHSTFNSKVPFNIRLFDPNVQSKHSIRTFNPNIRFEHSIRTFNPNIQSKHSIRTFNPNIQFQHSIRTFNSNIQFQNPNIHRSQGHPTNIRVFFRGWKGGKIKNLLQWLYVWLTKFYSKSFQPFFKDFYEVSVYLSLSIFCTFVFYCLCFFTGHLQTCTRCRHCVDPVRVDVDVARDFSRFQRLEQ